MTKKVVWLDRGGLPTYLGFCPCEKAWKREMKRLGVKGEPYPTSAGRCSSFEDGKGSLVVLITISEAASVGRSSIEVIGLLVHEATHAWQFILKDIGEKEPSSEFEAYAMQRMTQSLVQAYADTRERKLTT